MNVWHLVLREIAHRKLAFVLGVVSVFIAVAVLVGELGMLRAHDVETQRIVVAAEARTRRDLAGLEDDYRKITKGMGFNILILPKGQDLADFYAQGYASKFMPEEYVHRLANSKIITIQHLLPILEQKVSWPEQKRTIALAGVRGEVPIALADPKKPILQPVPPGSMVLGYELWRSAGIKVGQTVKLMGRDFKVHNCLGERGTKDDITVWIDLAAAQEMLGKAGQINAIMALECECAFADLPKVRQEVEAILPDTQIKELYTTALARAEARRRAAQAAVEAVDREKAERHERRRRWEVLGLWLVPTITVACGAWIALLTFDNVRRRRGEIAILRAIGASSVQIAGLVLARALLTGLAGAAVGYAAGLAAGLAGGDSPLAAGIAGTVYRPIVIAAVLVAAPVICGLAALFPALAAGRQDPAVVLQEE